MPDEFTDDFFFVDNLPERVLASMEVRDRWFIRTGSLDNGELFLVEDLLRWLPGQTVRVAFLGGDVNLHKDIEEATQEITNSCNLSFDFGFDAATNNYRTWSTNDTEYKAEIRVSFDEDGYFSLLGRDSISANIGRPNDLVGGRPHQRSLNLEGFNIQKPANWQGVVRHEFLHAVAFHHEHQSPSGGCNDEFRWQDDPGYQPTQNANGAYVNDSQGRRPGIYTYLAGYPNFWSKRTVDHNLRQISPAGVTSGPFDRRSIMLYRFPSLFYRSTPSPCAPVGNGIHLSEGDIAGLLHLYPNDNPDADIVTNRRLGVFDMLLNTKDLEVEAKENIMNQYSIAKNK